MFERENSRARKIQTDMSAVIFCLLRSFFKFPTLQKVKGVGIGISK